MRIIAGKARSRIIEAPKGLETRPTLDRVRETVFDIIQFQVESAFVLDLFAGSGAYGLEALSRGACGAVFNDMDSSARRVIQKNIQSLKFSDQSEVLGYEGETALLKLSNRGLTFDIIFLDPPYKLSLDKVLDKISSLSLLKQSGIVIAEVGEIVPKMPEQFKIYKTRKIGITTLLFICHA